VAERKPSVLPITVLLARFGTPKLSVGVGNGA